LRKDATDSPAPYRHQLPPGSRSKTKTDTESAAATASGFFTRARITRDGDLFPGTGTKFSDQLEYTESNMRLYRYATFGIILDTNDFRSRVMCR
jgi:hypothetical protein